MIVAKPNSSPAPIGVGPQVSYYPLKDLHIDTVTFNGPSKTNDGNCSFQIRVKNLNSTFTVEDKYKPRAENIRRVPARAACEGVWKCKKASRANIESTVPGIRCSDGWFAAVRYWQDDSGLDKFSADIGTVLQIGVGSLGLNWTIKGNTKDPSELSSKHRSCQNGDCSWVDFGEVVRDIRVSM